MVNLKETWRDVPYCDITLQGLFKRVRCSQADISVILDMIESMQRLFRQTSIVYEQQCYYSASIIRMVLVPVQQLMDTTTRLPASLESQRYALVKALHEVDSVGNDLALRITQYPLMYQGFSYPTVTQRWDIQRNFDKLIEGCEDILHESTVLLDTAHCTNAL